ncbi:TPA: hypothetical protein EYP38_02110, partial [Candidatus Micrarchaeota archaeon]|nr:hypothetical protein [Candidatus Micrarchaeota archaeon]
MRPRDATPRKKGRFGSVVRACAIAAALFSPFFMTKSARAEDATPEQPAPTCPGGDPVVPLECPISAGEEGTPACVVRTCSGSEVTLRRGDDSYSAFVVDRRRPLPRIEVEGPASVELRFYPAFRREDYNHLGRVEAHVSFVASSDGIDSRLHSFGAEVGSTSMTAVDAEGLNILPQSRAIAGSVGGTLEIDRSISGRPVTISFHENGSGEIPFGFLEVRISRPTRVVEPEAGPELTETEAEVAVETTPPEPAVVPEQEMPARRVFSLLGEREQ